MMWRMEMSLTTRRIAISAQLILLMLIIALVACNKSDKPSFQQFASPEEAGNGLLAAAKSGDPNTILAVFGPDSKDIVLSGDPVADKNTAALFAGAYGVMHRWRKMPDESQILLLGADNFAFPIPLKKNAAGQWYFDAAAGREEILARRIGRNELAIIDVSAALADGQAQYFSQKHGGVKQYAQKFISDPGQQNGLYWESPAGAPRSPMGPLVAFATEEGLTIKPGAAQPFYGYYFHRLDSQGAAAKGGAKQYVVNGKETAGFAYIAYPAKYDDSGVQTF